MRISQDSGFAATYPGKWIGLESRLCGLLCHHALTRGRLFVKKCRAYAYTWTSHSKWRHIPTNAALITIFRYLEDRNFLVQISLVNIVVSQTCKILMKFYGTHKSITFLKKTPVACPYPNIH